MIEQGIIVGSDKYEEWLLPWWWEHYKKTNSYPVAFADFGMTLTARKWCEERGECIDCPDLFTHKDQERISLDTRELWEKIYGVGIWNFRPVWFKKSYACQQSPFDKNIWIDLDCRIEVDLEPLFNLLEFNIEIALFKNNESHQKTLEEIGLLLFGENHYSSGVIAYRKKAPIISKWFELVTTSANQFSGDQEALSRAIFLQNPAIFDLPSIYNHPWDLPPSPNTAITHFGGQGKQKLLKELSFL